MRIRFGRQAEEALRRGDANAATAPLLRVLDIVGELLAGVRAKKTELNDKIADFYWFLFRRVSQAKINGDAAALAEVLRLLEYERQTWQLVCDKLEASAAAGEAGSRTARSPARHESWFYARRVIPAAHKCFLSLRDPGRGNQSYPRLTHHVGTRYHAMIVLAERRSS